MILSSKNNRSETYRENEIISVKNFNNFEDDDTQIFIFGGLL